MNYIYAITEENVDGCGSDATEYVSYKGPLTQEELNILKDCLDASKQESVELNTDDDTSDMVADAITRFQEKTGKLLESATDPIQGYVTF